MDPLVRQSLFSLVSHALPLSTSIASAYNYIHRTEEANRGISDAGAAALVELRVIKYAVQFDNNSDTADKVWTHVHKAFKDLVDKGDLPTADLRSVAALRKRFDLELGVLPSPSHDVPSMC